MPLRIQGFFLILFATILALIAASMILIEPAVANPDMSQSQVEMPTLCGDVDGSGNINIADLTRLWVFLFQNGPPPPFPEDADVDGCGSINASDLVHLWNYLFEAGPVPCAGNCNIDHGINWVRTVCGQTFTTGVDSVGLDVFVANDTPLRAMSLGFGYNADDIYEITSVSKAVALSDGLFSVTFKPSINQVLIGWMNSSTGGSFPIHSVAVRIATIWVKRSGPEQNGCVNIRRSFVGPAGPFIFCPSSGGVIIPQFVDCPDPEVEIGDGVTAIEPQYDAHQHWSLGNSEGVMWPDTMWNQYDYCAAGTPCKRCCILCESEDYPNWELFVDALGQNQCYFDPPPGRTSFRPSALAEWSAIKQPWSGSCFGFAATEAFYIDSLLPLLSDFPGCTELGSVVASQNSRNLINRFNLYQFGLRNQQRMAQKLQTVRFDQTLVEIQEMLQRITPIDKVLMMFNDEGPGAHVVFPYYCQTIDGSTWNVYVHDSNFPNDMTKYVQIHAEGWDYPSLPGWGGEYGLFLLDSLTTCLEPLVLMDTAEANQQIHFYFGETESADFSSPEGNIGFDGDYIYSTLEGGLPLFPMDGQNSRPVGYLLPTDEWYFEATGVADGVFTVIDGERRIFRIGGAKSGIISAPAAEQSSVTVYGIGSKLGEKGICDTSFIEVISVAPDSEIVVNISDITPTEDDTLTVTLADTATVQINNYGAARTYDLLVQIVTAATDTTFYHSNVVLDENCSHLISPDWRSSHDSIKIFCDEGIDGSIDSVFGIANAAAPRFVCGDANGSGLVTISDAVFLINYIFGGGPAPYLISAGDANCNGQINISDVVYLINYIFVGGAAPCAACP